MHTVRRLTLAALTGAGAAAKAMNNDTPQGGIIEMLPRTDRDGTCAELPKLCTAPVMMYGYATTVTYLCPATTTAHEPSTVHVTITKTTTVTPPEALPTRGSIKIPSVIAPAPTLTEEPDTTTTIHSTLTKYKTITLVSTTSAPLDTTPPPAASITGYLSATIPTELISSPTETEEPVFTIQTSTTPAVMSNSSSDFPTMSPPVFNGTTTGIFYTASAANSTLVQPTAFFPNTTTSHRHYALPTWNVENRAAADRKDVKGAAEKLRASFITLVFGVVASAFAAYAPLE